MRANDFTNHRDLALVSVLADTGCRVSEVVNLRLGDLDLRECTAKVVGWAAGRVWCRVVRLLRRRWTRSLRVRRRQSLSGSVWQ